MLAVDKMKNCAIWFSLVVLALSLAAWPYARVVDVLTGRTVRLAAATTLDGQHIELVEQWDWDLYRVDLVHTLTNGTRVTCVVDPDTFRTKDSLLLMCPENQTVTITCRDRPSACYNWERRVLVRGSGVQVHALEE
jgi:hypothetical protein